MYTPFKIGFLGGQDSSGGPNMIVVIFGDYALGLDCGRAFAGGLETLGVSWVLPNLQAFVDLPQKRKAIFISHAHLDHYGGLAALLKMDPSIIVVCSPLAAEFIRQMLKDLRMPTANLRLMSVGQCAYWCDEELVIGDKEEMDEHQAHILHRFCQDSGQAIEPTATSCPTCQRPVVNLVVESFFLGHSVPEAMGFITRIFNGDELVNVVYMPDFNLVPDYWGQATDLVAIGAQIRERGRSRNILLIDSTGALETSEPPAEGEAAIGANILKIAQQSSGALLATAFGTSFGRIQSYIGAAEATGRKLIPVGMSVQRALEIGFRHGLLQAQAGTVVSANQSRKLPRERRAYLLGGTQGESGSAYLRVAMGQHPWLTAEAEDTAMIFASIIPGHEDQVLSIYQAFDELGVDFYSPELGNIERIHLSGHCSRGQLIQTLQPLRPDHLVPIAGSTRARNALVKWATINGMAASLVQNGQTLVVAQDQTRVKEMASEGGLIYATSDLEPLSSRTIHLRETLAQAGIIWVTLLREDGKWREPTIQGIGVHLWEPGRLIAEVKAALSESSYVSAAALAQRLRELFFGAGQAPYIHVDIYTV